MPRCIYADDIKNAIDGVTRNYLSTLSATDTIDGVTAKWLYKRLRILVDEMPTADVRENVYGKWEQGVCLECGYNWGKVAPIASVPNFCPKCGADMREGRENDCD